MTTDTDDDGFTTVHQSAAFAGAGAVGVVRPDLPLTLSAAQAEIVALRGRVAELERRSVQVVFVTEPTGEHSRFIFTDPHEATRFSSSASKLPGYTVTDHYDYAVNTCESAMRALTSEDNDEEDLG